MTLALGYKFDILHAYELANHFSRRVCRRFGIEAWHEDVAHDASMAMWHNYDYLVANVQSSEYLSAVVYAELKKACSKYHKELYIKHDIYHYSREFVVFNLAFLLSEATESIVIDYPDLCPGLSSLAVQCDFNEALSSLTNKQQEALALRVDGRLLTDAERTAHNRAINRLVHHMNNAGETEGRVVRKWIPRYEGIEDE